MFTAPPFDTLWMEHRRQVFALAIRAFRNRDQAEEIVQRVAIRVWRGLPRFRGDCPLVAWIMAITRAEIARFIHELELGRRNEPIDPEMPAMPPEVIEELQPIGRAILEAQAEGMISSVESAVLQTRLAMAEENWPEIGHRLGIAAETCASHHCRAVQKLRVFMCVRHPEAFGGKEAFRQASELCRTEVNLLTQEEALLFADFVLGDRPLSQAMRKPSLRSACDKVVRRMKV